MSGSMNQTVDGLVSVGGSRRWLALAVGAVLCPSASAVAQTTWHVDNVPGDAYNPPAKSTVYATIQEAIDLSANGDTVLVWPGTYTSTGAEVVNLRGKAIVVEAAVPYDTAVSATWATIDGQNARRGIVATLNEESSTVVRGLRVFAGRSSAGGGMYVVNGSPRIEDCWFANNVATGGVASGGALRLLNSVSMIEGCFFEDNSADAEGGAIFNAGGAIMASACDFKANRALRGGGIFARDDASRIEHCVFRDTVISSSGNSWKGFGAYTLNSTVSFTGCLFRDMRGIPACCSGPEFVGIGIFIIGAEADVRVTGCEFVDLRAEGNGRGGAIALGWPGDNRGTSHINSCIFRRCFASVDGGAIAMQSTDLLQIDGEGGVPTIFENNSANRHGGAISVNVDWVDSGTLLLDEARFRNNAAGSAGGAIWIRQTGGVGTRVLTDSVFTNNSAVNGGALYLDGSAIRSQLGRTVYCGNDPNDVQGAYLESDPNCFTIACTDEDGNGYPDTCEIPITDCNGNGISDDEELVGNDVNNDLIPDDCQERYLDFAGLESELVAIEGAGSSGYPGTAALCWRVYAKTNHPDASVVSLFGNGSYGFSVTASGGFFNVTSGADGGLTSANIPCNSASNIRYDSYFTIGAACRDDGTIFTTPGLPAFNNGQNYSFNNGAIYVTPGASGSEGGPAQRVLLMQLTTYQAVKPTASINLLGRHHLPEADGTVLEWEAYGLPIPDPILVDCNRNGVHDAIEIATGVAPDADRNGVPDSCQGCQGDVDGNGVVNVDDLLDLFVAWGDPTPGNADIDGDGIVGPADLTLLLQGWGNCL